MQQKLNTFEKKESSYFVITNVNNYHNSSDNMITKKLNPKEIEKDKMVEVEFNFKAYLDKVEKMNKILEDSFFKEREKCLTVVEIEDRPHITSSDLNGFIDTNQNINNLQVKKFLFS